MDFSNQLDMLADIGTRFGVKVVAALAVLIIGRWVAKALANSMNKVLTRRNVDPTLTPFLVSVTYWGLMSAVIVAAINQVGVATASIIGILGAAGLAIGLALQGSLSNLAAGVMLLIFRPFKVGDFVEIGGINGTVESLHLFSTDLKTGDNKQVIVPNGQVFGEAITNYSAKPLRRVDMVFGIGYEDDIDQARKTISAVLEADERVLDDPAPLIAVHALADSSVNFAVRPWVKTEDYWGVYFDTHEAIKKRFDAEGISIPYPQTDVHLHKVEQP